MTYTVVLYKVKIKCRIVNGGFLIFAKITFTNKEQKWKY